MRKLIHYAGAILLIAAFISCSNPTGNDQKTNTSDEKNTEQSDKTGTSEDADGEFVSVQHTIKARFIMQNLSTAGVVFSVEDDKGNDYIFWDRNPDAKGIRFLNNHPADAPLDELEDTWFDLTYENRMCEFFDGSTGDYYEREELVIIEAKPWEERESLEKSNKSESLSPDLVSSLTLSGTEPFWTIDLYIDHAVYNDPGTSNLKMYYLVKYDEDMGFAHINDALETQEDGSVSLRIQEEGTSEYTRLTIAKEECSDGMSDEKYQYSVVYQKNQGPKFEGCGNARIK